MGIRLLIVDDCNINLELSGYLFGMEGAQIITATNGKQAVDWLAAHPCEVDMVLMDVHMPIMNGLEATRHIRQLPKTGQLPIVAFTTDVVNKQQQAIFAAGMNDVIPKPLILDNAIKQMLVFLRPETVTAENTQPPLAGLS